jgi:hypothetical protein
VIELCDKHKNLAFTVLLAHNNAPGHLKISLLSIQRNTPQVSAKEYHIAAAVIHIGNHCNIQELKHLPLNS